MRLITLTILSAALTSAFGCPDTAGQLDEFVEASEPLRVTPSAGECIGPAALAGTYLMGAATTVDPTKPILFELKLTTDLGAATIDGTLQAFAVPPNNGATAPGTRVGEVYTATADLDATSGGFALDFGTIDVPIEANPILAAPVVATLSLEGCTATETESCGIIVGEISSPAQIPLAGSTWGITPLADGVDPMTLTPVTGCPE